jgi:hypothetical protein
MKQDKYNWEERFDELFVKDKEHPLSETYPIVIEYPNVLKEFIQDIISNERKRIIDSLKRNTKLNRKYTKREITDFISEIKLEE